MKCVRDDLYSQSFTLHFMNDGNVYLKILLKKQEFIIPLILILRSLADVSDVELYSQILIRHKENQRMKDSVNVLLAESTKYGYRTQAEYTAYIGSRFRELLNLNETDLSDVECGKVFLKENLLIHLDNNHEKIDVLCLMVEKLYLLAFGELKPENLDSLLNQEVLLSGHLYLMVLRERLEDVLIQFKSRILKLMGSPKPTATIRNIQLVKTTVESIGVVKRGMEYFLATGTLNSKTGLDLMQMTGYSIIAERINNIRYVSHFRSIHRGQFFTEMKTTEPRKLLPESWGFVCPVHTPDGSPCGLLNHITMGCEVITSNYEGPDFSDFLLEIGMISTRSVFNELKENSYTVMLDGRIVGYVGYRVAKKFINQLRRAKVSGQIVPNNLEIGFIPKEDTSKIMVFPGIFLFTGCARMTRRIINISLSKEELIGPIEQLYLSIACLPEDIRKMTTHIEIDPIRMLSIIASLTPFCDYNQSPRNMYQCQMAKQTMALTYFNYQQRNDNKIYRLVNCQAPLVASGTLNEYGFNNYPSGTNAIVAVLSYTGYDMEDAMIINKSAYERGLGHGFVYKTATKRLNEDKVRSKRYRMLIEEDLKRKDLKLPDHIDKHGCPLIGTKLFQDKEELIYFDTQTDKFVIKKFKDTEQATVEDVKVFSGDSPSDVCVSIRYSFKRNPIIGDKFSSRHGQKGVLSILWPQINMPFSESGMTPDIIINPHAFPSRMTIGMLIESLAGKNCAIKGEYQQITAFQQFEEDNPVAVFGEELAKNGFDYYGNEILYSGISGEQLEVKIYMGVVYYQRLRHMVSDKAQARSTGPIDVLTQQPVKGRKNQGGIRFGEMERDALLAHGTSFCLNDRLFKSSDYSQGFICKSCGEFLGAIEIKEGEGTRRICRSCNGQVEKVELPYVLRYLTNELAAMNIKMNFELQKKVD